MTCLKKKKKLAMACYLVIELEKYTCQPSFGAGTFYKCVAFATDIGGFWL